MADDPITLVLLLVGSSSDHIAPTIRLVNHLTAASSLPLDIRLATDVPQPNAPRSWKQHLLSTLPAECRAAAMKRR